MIYYSFYDSKIGKMLLASRGGQLIGIWFEGSKYYLYPYYENMQESSAEEILVRTKHWLDQYFQGKNPQIEELDIYLIGSEFQLLVWKTLMSIPYGTTITYGELSKIIAKKKGVLNMSSQAIGGALSRNPIAIAIPCHRVVGKNGNLTGYAGGLNKKSFLLEHEKENFENCVI